MNELDRFAVSLENMEVLRAQIDEQAREIERLEAEVEDVLVDWGQVRLELAALKAQQGGVVLPERKQESPSWGYDMGGNYEEGHADGWNQALDEIDRLNHSAKAGDGQSEEGLEEWAKGKFGIGGRYIGKLYGNTDWALARAVWSAALSSAALSANHSEQVRDGWQLVPVEPTDAMLEAGDKYIGTPATYKSMLSACPSPAITKDFSQFLSAVMDAAGLIRHGRQSKELSEYLGMKCMEYRGAALSAPSHGEQVRHMVRSAKRSEEE